MATPRQSSSHPTNSSKPSSSNRPGRYKDPLAELHAYRRQLAARFNYDDARIIDYLNSQPLPRGMREIVMPPRKKKPSRKSA
ncbi:MAG: hypothetical protein ACLQVN_12515 [Bryobacteraceae bacterium]